MALNRILRFPGKMRTPAGWPTVIPATIADDFERPNSTVIGSTPIGGVPWVDVNGGVFSVQDGQVMANAATGLPLLRLSTGLADFEVEAQIGSIGNTPATMQGGIAIGGSDCWLSTRISGTVLGIGFYAGGGVIGESSSLVVKSGDVLKVKKLGSVLQGFVNGLEVARATRAATNVGQTGFIAGPQASTRWESIQIRPL